MEYVIGIDGGGTKTLLKIADLKGNMLVQLEGGASNINSIGKVQTEKVLKELILNALSNINETLKNCRAICLGMAGVDRPDDRTEMEKIISSIGYCGKKIITNDAVTALYGGLGGKEGVIIISGTGSICYGRNLNGMVCRAGGWGHIMGDEGSAYDIAVKALKAVAKGYDGRGDATLISDIMLKQANLNSPEDLIEYVYRSGAGKKEIASFARAVDQAYKMGDLMAENILNDAAYELFLCCKTVIEKLGFQNKNVSIVYSGSVLEKNKHIFDEFSALIRKSYPQLSICRLKYDAAWGAVLIALDAVKNS